MSESVNDSRRSEPSAQAPYLACCRVVSSTAAVKATSTSRTVGERVGAFVLWVLAALMFAAALPALVESHGVSALIMWPGAVLIAYAAHTT